MTRVVIVGRDAALWLSAAALQRALAPAGVTVSAVELPTRLGPASVYATLPPIEALHARLGIDEAQLLGATRGSFALGWNVVAPDARPFFLAHGCYGAPIDGNPFFPHWLKAKRLGMDAALEDFCPTAMAARQGRMLLPDDETAAFGRTDYGYHLPAPAYAAALKARAARLGVTVQHALEVAVERGGETGAIAAVRLDGGARVAGDLFIDASGADAVLIGGAPGIGQEDWRRFFVADRRMVALAPAFASTPAYAELRIGNGGWTALHASQAATHVVHAYRSDEQDEAGALAAASAVAGLPLTDPMATSVAPGRRAGWVANCVAIGEAACAFDPLFEVELHAVQLGLVHLLELFPVSAAFAAERDEYNRVTQSAFERVRDVQAAFHALSRFGARAAAAPPGTAHAIATYAARGATPPVEDESFAPDWWQAMAVGLGHLPESWPPAIDRTPPERINAEFRHMLGFIKAKVLAQPTHDFYVKTLCRSEAA